MGKNTIHYRNSFAISLVELWIYLLLASICLLGILQIYQVLQRTLGILHARMDLAQKYHVTSFIIKHYLMQAGYRGPIGNLTTVISSKVNPAILGRAIALGAIARCNTGNISCKALVNAKIWKKILSKQIKPNSDILLLYDIPVKVSYLLEDMANNGAALVVSADFLKELAPKDELIIADLMVNQRFIISNIIKNRIEHYKTENFNNDLVKKFKRGSEIFKVDHLVFYLAKEEHLNTDDYSLYLDRLAVGSKAQAVVSGLQDFKVKIINSNLVENDPKIVGEIWEDRTFLLIQVFFSADNKATNLLIGF